MNSVLNRNITLALPAILPTIVSPVLRLGSPLIQEEIYGPYKTKRLFK